MIYQKGNAAVENHSEMNEANLAAGVAIAEFLQALDDGSPLDVEGWLAKYPQHQASLREFLKSENELLSLVGKPISASPVNKTPDGRNETKSILANPSESTPAREKGDNEQAGYEGSGNVVADDKSKVKLDNYQLGEVVGQGGMGIVYQATDNRLNRQVAIKVMRSGVFADQRERRRFRREAEAVAQLEHPNIVPIYEVGESDDQDFFVMKLLKPLQSANEPQAKTFQDKQAAEKMIPICEAIHFAHQRGILHRDLKPANILQNHNGIPYVADFGLAKKLDLSDESTVEEFLVGTPAFVAPEQLSGDSTIQSDVYGLGAILDWMLTGNPPHSAKTLPDLLASFQRLHPTSPRTIRSSIDRDLEIVCLKCLNSDPKMRYQNAQAVGEDLKRWLASEPILAKPASVRERVAKFCKRKPAIAALASVLIAISLISLSVFAVQYKQITITNKELENLNSQLLDTIEQEQSSRTLAESNERVSESVKNLLIDSFRSANPAISGREIKVADQLIAAKDKLIEDKGLDPVTRGAALEAIGVTLTALGLITEAKPILIQSEASFAEVLDDSNARLLVCRGELGHLHYLTGDLQKAIEVLESVIRGYENIGEANRQLHHAAINYLSLALADSGKPDRAIELLVPVYDFQKKHLEKNAEPFTQTANNLGHALMAAGKMESALPYMLEAFEGQQERFGPQDPRTMISKSNVAVIYLKLNQPQKAFPLLEEVLEHRKQVLGENHHETLVAENNLAGVYMTSGEREKAIETLSGLLPRLETQLGPKHLTTLGVRYNLGGGYMSTGRHREAVDIFVAYAEDMTKLVGPTHSSTLKARTNQAICLEQLEQHSAARDIFQELVEIERSNEPVRSESLALTLESLGRVLNRLEDYQEAETVLREAVLLRERNSDKSWRAFVGMSLLGESLLGQQKIEEASPLLMESYEALQSLQESIPNLNREAILEMAGDRVGRLQQFQSTTPPSR
jgi:eukaryotic-like serine/threonine-protein kinase